MDQTKAVSDISLTTGLDKNIFWVEMWTLPVVLVVYLSKEE
jgi:hypothetical protein